MAQRKKKKIEAIVETQETEIPVKVAKVRKEFGALPEGFDIDANHSFKRAAWKHILRIFWVSVVVVLNVAMVASFIERYQDHRLLHPAREIFFFMFLLLIDVFMAGPMILEANKVETDKDAITLHLLAWRVRIPWQEVREFSQPSFIKFTILFSKHCRYFMNKYDLKDFGQLAQIILAKSQKP
ncbi:hypothetical protein KA183_07415 [bacterium]|nr:hypothetical protein [bacterium]QQR58291.1 MAG: hypothetical protein IPG59_02010 [Candidatus Melainabacteria bacterium]